jgi:hypothetical protein
MKDVEVCLDSQLIECCWCVSLNSCHASTLEISSGVFLLMAE